MKDRGGDSGERRLGDTVGCFEEVRGVSRRKMKGSSYRMLVGVVWYV